MGPDLYLKTLVVGGSCVGKTALVSMFKSDGADFPKSYMFTRDVDVSMKEMLLPDNQGLVTFIIQDCSGMPVYEKTVEKTWDQLSGVIVVYDVTDRKSFEEAVRWGGKVMERFGKSTRIPAVLLGNRTDLTLRRKVTTEEGVAMAKSMSCAFVECSAKSWEDVTVPFRLLGLEIVRLYKERIAAVSGVHANTAKTTKTEVSR